MGKLHELVVISCAFVGSV